MRKTVGMLHLKRLARNLPVMSVPPVEAPAISRKLIAIPEIIPQKMAATRESLSSTGATILGRLLMRKEEAKIVAPVSRRNCLPIYL